MSPRSPGAHPGDAPEPDDVIQCQGRLGEAVRAQAALQDQLRDALPRLVQAYDTEAACRRETTDATHKLAECTARRGAASDSLDDCAAACTQLEQRNQRIESLHVARVFLGQQADYVRLKFFEMKPPHTRSWCLSAEGAVQLSDGGDASLADLAFRFEPTNNMFFLLRASRINPDQNMTIAGYLYADSTGALRVQRGKPTQNDGSFLWTGMGNFLACDAISLWNGRADDAHRDWSTPYLAVVADPRTNALRAVPMPDTEGAPLGFSSGPRGTALTVGGDENLSHPDHRNRTRGGWYRNDAPVGLTKPMGLAGWRTVRKTPRPRSRRRHAPPAKRPYRTGLTAAMRQPMRVRRTARPPRHNATPRNRCWAPYSPGAGFGQSSAAKAGGRRAGVGDGVRSGFENPGRRGAATSDPMPPTRSTLTACGNAQTTSEEALRQCKRRRAALAEEGVRGGPFAMGFALHGRGARRMRATDHVQHSRAERRNGENRGNDGRDVAIVVLRQPGEHAC